MKKTSMIQVAVFLLAVMAGACSGGGSGEVGQLQRQIDSLRQADEQHKSELNDMNAFVGALAQSFDTISVLENQLFDSSLEGKSNARELMKEKLQLFSETLSSQRERINALSESLRAKGADVERLQGLVNMLNDQLDQKDRMISQLKSELNNKNVDIANLKSHVSQLTKANKEFAAYVENQLQAQQQQEEQDNTAYVVVGSAKVLKDAGITSGGGLLSKKKVNTDSQYFTRKDIRQFTQLEIPSGSAKVVSQMPRGSYTIEKVGKDQSILTITDPATFWSQTRYLVVQTK